MGCDFVRVKIDEHLGDQPDWGGGTYKGYEGDKHNFDCPGINIKREAHYFVYGYNFTYLQYFRLNLKDSKKWIEPVMSPGSSTTSQTREGLIGPGELKERGNWLQVYSNPNAQFDDFVVRWILFLYHTK